MLLFTQSQLRPDNNSNGLIWGEFFWPFLSKHTAALSLSVALVTLPQCCTEDATPMFFSKSSWTCTTLRRVWCNVNLMITVKEKKRVALETPLSREGCTTRATWEKKRNKMVFKIYVVYLHTHEKPAVIGNPRGWGVVLLYALSYSTLGKTSADHFHMEIPSICMIIVKDKMHITRGDWKSHECVQLFKLPML